MIDNTLYRLRESYMRLYEKEKLKGGLADGKSLEDIAKKHGVSIEDIRKEFHKGIEVEKEHTNDKSIAAEIAKDHLIEDDPFYYTNLEKIHKD